MGNRQELVDELREAYANAPKGNTACTIHLFGIKHGDALREFGSLAKLAKDAGVPESYAVEINKGINLSRYVTIK